MEKQGSPITDGFPLPAQLRESDDEMFLVQSRRGVYTPPRILPIAGIPGVVVDPHNEVFPYWWAFSQDRQAVVIHIDNHSDIQADTPLLNPGTRADATTIDDYTRSSLTIASFIAPAIHYRVAGPVYWVDPRRNFSYTYGRIRQGRSLCLGTAIHDEHIQWDPSNGATSLNTELGNEQLVAELREYVGPLIVDIDLDAFDCISDRAIDEYPLLRMQSYERGDPCYRLCIKKDPMRWPGVRHPRIKKTLDLLASLPRPGLITIARSQTPLFFVPPEVVDDIEAQTIVGLTALYRN